MAHHRDPQAIRGSAKPTIRANPLQSLIASSALSLDLHRERA
jgi:hypothetical protein